MPKLCECGCGRETSLIHSNDPEFGRVRGEYSRYLLGHSRHKTRNVKPHKYADLATFIDPCDEDLERANYYSTVKAVQRSHKTPAHYRIRNNVLRGFGTIRLHREIAERMIGRPLGPTDVVDHRNGNGLDNRRANLRVVTNAMNCQNKIGLSVKNTSGYRGVNWYKQRQKWEAKGTVNGKRTHLGFFSDKEEANRVVVAWRLANMPGALD